MAEWCQRQRLPLLWWSLVFMIAATLKVYFSAATASQLGWMFEPITHLLRLIAGWHFKPNADGEWQSMEAGIVLVKACAGINFMIMSLLAWSWVMRPRAGGFNTSMTVIEIPLLLTVTFLFAWLATLVANTLRILAVVYLQPVLEHWLGAEAAHRFLGLLIYLAALTAQVLLTEWQRRERALPIVCVLYVGIMLVLPLATGHALADLALYARHSAMVLAALVPLAAVAILLRVRRR